MRSSRKIISLLCLTLYIASFACFAASEIVLPLGSKEGQKLFASATYKDDYWPLSRYYITQANLNFCGVASATMIMNSLQLEAPVPDALSPFAIFTQENVLLSRVREGLNIYHIAQKGMTLQQFAQVFTAWDVPVETFTAINSNAERFREHLRMVLNNPKQRMAVNYSRPVLGQAGIGHISPVAAYDEASDKVLILDVSRYKYPPIWVAVDKLWEAMDTEDSETECQRGYAIISAR